jgi:hypothetical protein
MNLPPAMMNVGDFGVIDLPENERLSSSAQSVVSVEPGTGPDKTKWTVRAEAKGMATVSHIGADGQTIDSVDVTIPNQAPKRSSVPNPATSTFYPLVPATGADAGLSMTNFFLEQYFTDLDGDELKYTFTSISPNVLFVKARKTTPGAKCCTIIVDVLSEEFRQASIVVHATDTEDAQAVGTLEFQLGIGDGEPTTAPNDGVVPRTYHTDQQNDGHFATIVRAGLRKHVEHTLNFRLVDLGGDTTPGFKFAEIFAAELTAPGGKLVGATVTYTGATFVSTLPPAAGLNDGSSYYTISKRKGDPVTLGDLVPNPSPDTDPPNLMFSVTGVGEALATISFHVWDTDLNDDTDTDDAGWQTASETVNIEIAPVPAYAGSDGKFPE